MSAFNSFDEFVQARRTKSSAFNSFDEFVQAQRTKVYVNVSFDDRKEAKCVALAYGKALSFDREASNPVTKKSGCWYYTQAEGAAEFDPPAFRKFKIKESVCLKM